MSSGLVGRPIVFECNIWHRDNRLQGRVQEEIKAERDSAVARLTARADTSLGAGLRTSQTAPSEVDELRAGLLVEVTHGGRLSNLASSAKAEEALAQTKADLDKQTNVVTDLMKLVGNEMDECLACS